MSFPPSVAFKVWHAKRAAEIIKNAEALAEEYIKDGFSDSTSTRRTAIYKVLESVDETGWAAWQSGRAQALEEAALACESAAASIWDYHDDGRKQIGTTVCNNLAAAIRKIKEQA